ncbi:MAG: glycosyltransferase [Ignavibacteria bacterium]|nr:glycosyltransferase [Ignavibacteria bacterium]
MRALPKPPSGSTGWPWDEEAGPEIYKGKDYFPKISIITPSYNQGKYIEQTIRSVLLQNYPNMEYIIIDGGSSDNSPEIIKKYSRWIKYFVSEKDKGQSDAINKGLLKCEGEIFNWINSDDYYNKDCFKTIAENFSSKDTDIAAGKNRMFFINENKVKTVGVNLMNTLEETIALSAVSQPATFYRLNVFKNLGGLDERLEFVMDQDLWIKYLFKYGQDKIKILNKELTNFRVHTESKTSQNDFIEEYYSIFYSISQKTGMTGHSAVLKKIYGEGIQRDFDFSFDFTKEKIRLAKKVINSLVYFNARKAYTGKDMELLKDCLSVLDKKYLNEEQKSYTLNLKIKLKLIKYKLKPVLNLINSRNKKADF